MSWEPFECCTEPCAVPVPCPVCGRDLPPRGRSVAPETYMPNCCEVWRYDGINTRHIWSTDELPTPVTTERDQP